MVPDATIMIGVLNDLNRPPLPFSHPHTQSASKKKSMNDRKSLSGEEDGEEEESKHVQARQESRRRHERIYNREQNKKEKKCLWSIYNLPSDLKVSPL